MLNGSYNLWLVALSYAIASAASYAALRLARISNIAGSGQIHPLARIAPAAIMLGSGIWTMHFVGMMAFSLHGMKTSYRLDLTLLSLAIAIAFTGIGFATLILGKTMREQFVLAGIPMGLGILTMHYLGMAAMKGDMDLRYDTLLVAASGVIAIGASIAALWLTMQPGKLARRTLSALAMGAAICGMHYTGMQAAIFKMPEREIAFIDPGHQDAPGH